MYTLSWHQGGQGTVRQSHNRRDAHALGHDSDIDSTRTHDNITLVDIPIRQAYNQIFGQAQAEYNARARQSRQIADYYTQIDKSNKHTAYEIIVQLGSRAEGTPQGATDALKRYVAEWGARNPNLCVVGAYIHNDEQSCHAHIDYIPVAVCNRGMRLQNTVTGALAAQGFKTKSARQTAQMEWEQAERDAMRQICRDMGIELNAQGHGRRNMTIPEYKQYADNLNRLKQSVRAEEAFLSVTMQQTAQAQMDAVQAVERTAQETRRAERAAEQTAQAQAATLRICKRAEQAQDTLHALDAEIKRMRTEYTTAYNTALQNNAISILRSDPDGQQWWAFAVEQAARNPELQTYLDFMDSMERQQQQLELDPELDPEI